MSFTTHHEEHQMSVDTYPVISGAWTIDRAHSTLGFAVRHMVVSTFRGRFEDFDATLEMVDGDYRLTGTVQVASLEVRDPDLAAHLRAPDFFDADRHPELRFASTAMQIDGDRVEVAGDLTIRGVTRPVRGTGTVIGPVDDPFGGVRVGLEVEAVVDRREYGLEWNMPLPKGGLALGNEVRLQLALEFVRA